MAAYLLGSALATGTHGLPLDLTESIHWLEKSLSGSMSHRHMSKEYKLDAQRKLEDATKKFIPMLTPPPKAARFKRLQTVPENINEEPCLCAS